MSEFRNNIFVLIGMVMFLDSYSRDDLISFLEKVETEIENDTTTIEEYLKVIDFFVG
jgi:hypothetical protein